MGEEVERGAGGSGKEREKVEARWGRRWKEEREEVERGAGAGGKHE